MANYTSTHTGAVIDASVTKVSASGVTQADFTKLNAVTSSATELNLLDGVTSTTAEINILDGVTSTAAEINILDGVTATTAEINLLDGLTATTTELNLIDGVTATTAEINYIDGVTSNIQTQLNLKAPLAGASLTGTTSFQNLSDGTITITAFADEDDFSSNSATLLATQQSIKAYVDAEVSDNNFTTTLKNKLDAIEASATADQSNAEIRTAVEAATDSNVFTDADHSKLNAIEASATADQTNAEIVAAVEAGSDSNTFTDADHSKLNAIEASADVTDTANVTSAGALMDSELTDLAGVKGVTISTLQPKPSEGAFANGDKTKLDAIEAGATADQTDEEIQDIVGAMFTSTNTETGITATYQDATGDIDLVVGTLNQDTTGNADTATKIASITNSNIVQLTDTQTLTNKTLASPTFTGDVTFNDASTPQITITDTTNTAQLKLFATDTTTDIGSLSDHKVNFRYNNDIRLQLEDTKFMINAGSDDMDFTVKDASGLQALHVDAGDGDVNIRTLDVSGDADIDGTLETDALTIGGVTSVPFEAADHSKLDGIAASANNYVLPLKDEDNMASNSSTHVSSQQSIKAYVDAEVAGVVDSSPAALNTLNELAAALGDDANFSTTTSTSLGNRLRVDTASQGLNGTQQANAITNLGITSTKAELNILDGVTATATELNLIDGVTATTAELNILDGVTSTAAELNILDGVTATAAELNIMDGVTATTAELNYTDGVTSNIQTQLDATLDTAGTGIDISSTTVSVDVSDFMSNGVNNYVLTATGTDAFRGEGNLTFDGSTLAVTGAITGSSTLNVTGVTTLQNHLELGDSDKIKLGASADLEIYHDGTNSVINNTQTGALQIYNNVDNGMVELLTDNGSGGTQVFLRADGANNMVRMPVDGVKFTLGAASDLQLYHDGSNNYLRNNTTDQDFSILVNDGGSTITAMKIDASENGRVKLPNDLQELTFGVGGDGVLYSYQDDFWIQNVTQDQDIKFRVNDGGVHTDALFIQGSTTNVGIGTTSPSKKFVVKGASGDQARFEHNGAVGAVDIYSGTDGGLLIVRNPSGTAIIELDGRSGNLELPYGRITDAGTDMNIVSDNALTLGTESGTALTFANASLAAVFADDVNLTATKKLYLDGGGNTYIHENTADSVYMVVGGVNIMRFYETSSEGYAYAEDNNYIGVGSSIDFTMRHDGSNTYLRNSTGNLFIRNRVDTTTIFDDHNGVEHLNIDLGSDVVVNQGGGNIDFRVEGDTDTHLIFADASADSVGIGTSSPSMKLNISHGDQDGLRFTAANTHETFIDFGDTDDNDAGSIRYDHNDNSLAFRVNASERARIDSSGNVGIGVASPGAKLHIVHNGSAVVKAESTAGGYGAYSRLTTTTNSYSLVSLNGDFLIDEDGQATRFIIKDSTGNIGIGTASPATKLEVDGILTMEDVTAPAEGVSGHAQMFSNGGEMKVNDASGTITTISPHNFELIPEGASEDMAWSHHSVRGNKKVNVDMMRLARLVEELTGEKLVYTDEQ